MTIAHTDENGVTVIVANDRHVKDGYTDFKIAAEEMIKRAIGKDTMVGGFYVSGVSINDISPCLHHFPRQEEEEIKIYNTLHHHNEQKQED